MKFVVIGAGGVGGFFGGKLANAGEDVWFVARGKHLEAMRRSGLLVHSTEGDFTIPPGKMTDRPDKVGPADVILFCVKSYHTENASQQLAPLLKEETIVISLQNGVDNEDKIQRIIPAGTVWGGVSYIYSAITAPGEVTETGGPKKIVFGPLTGNTMNSQIGGQIQAATLRAGINAAFTLEIESEIWRKFIFISAVGGMTSMTRFTLAEILDKVGPRELLEGAMRESVEVARARGVSIEDGYIAQVFDVLRTSNNNSRSSMYHDLAHEKPLEIEALSGTVIRYGGELGIPTPIHRTIYESLLPFHLKHISPKDPTR